MKQAEQERLESEERERLAKRPRHQDLDLSTMLEGQKDESRLALLRATLEASARSVHSKHVANLDAFVFGTDEGDAAAVKDLKERFRNLRIVSRAKVTGNRVYSAAYHPDKNKDLVFFGGMCFAFEFLVASTQRFRRQARTARCMGRPRACGRRCRRGWRCTCQ